MATKTIYQILEQNMDSYCDPSDFGKCCVGMIGDDLVWEFTTMGQIRRSGRFDFILESFDEEDQKEELKKFKKLYKGKDIQAFVENLTYPFKLIEIIYPNA